MSNRKQVEEDEDGREFNAIATVFAALKVLSPQGQERVIEYVAKKLGLSLAACSSRQESQTHDVSQNQPVVISRESVESPTSEANSDFDGISPVAIKWIRRNGLEVSALGSLFSLGTDEIDLVAKSVPGSSKNLRTRSVTLLKGVAAYLSSGVARISNEQIKEACLHYDAYDSPNHAKYLRQMASELSGSKETGFTLTARGLTAATDMIRELLTQRSGN